ncbi:hypothetical protein H920_00358 [Fukomys damarensis]|uniref:Uncharacterized protein n=1 Tax=Fukomys damarensis TaxID=885580 RepID=A0A091E6Q3_FUKDA|nr:hypothetical protein H920_00358 [Fukomys damarensis]
MPQQRGLRPQGRALKTRVGPKRAFTTVLMASPTSEMQLASPMGQAKWKPKTKESKGAHMMWAKGASSQKLSREWVWSRSRREPAGEDQPYFPVVLALTAHW